MAAGKSDADLVQDKPRLTTRAQFPTTAERDRVIRDYGADTEARRTIARLAEFPAKHSA